MEEQQSSEVETHGSKAAPSDKLMERLNPSGELNAIIRQEVKEIYGKLKSLQEEFHFPPFRTVSQPMVLVLGNHSSGKSTFINHLIGQPVQKTGRAPTDYAFTIISGGRRPEKLDGRALIRSDKFPFGDVEALFGRDFVSQVELKVIKGSELLDQTGMLLVDSPGMIDPPGMKRDSDGSHQRSDMDRGYDYKRVVRWFAVDMSFLRQRTRIDNIISYRSDVIILMFDPDKPGTTFETLDVLTSSLSHVSNKLHVVLNKVDDFRSVHDFARAYGALCWNLSKVTPRKDMPHIYAMYVPLEENALSPRSRGTDGKATELRRLFAREFDSTREELIHEVSLAPERSTDNLISELKGTTRSLEMHCSVLEECRADYFALKKRLKIYSIAIASIGISAAVIYLYKHWGTRSAGAILSAAAKDIKPEASAGGEAAAAEGSQASWKAQWAMQEARAKVTFSWSNFLSILGATGGSVLVSLRSTTLALQTKQNRAVRAIDGIFQRLYAREIANPDTSADIQARWTAARPSIELALGAVPLEDMPPLTGEKKEQIKAVLSTHIPRLDRCVRDRIGDDHHFLLSRHRTQLSSLLRTKSV